jgi:hypothetical protein
LAESLVTQADVERKGLTDSIVILHEACPFPYAALTLRQPEVVERGKNIAEFGAVAKPPDLTTGCCLQKVCHFVSLSLYLE